MRGIGGGCVLGGIGCIVTAAVVGSTATPVFVIAGLVLMLAGKALLDRADRR